MEALSTFSTMVGLDRDKHHRTGAPEGAARTLSRLLRAWRLFGTRRRASFGFPSAPYSAQSVRRLA